MESKKESAGSLFQCYLYSFGKFRLVHPFPNQASYGSKQKLFQAIALVDELKLNSNTRAGLL